MDTFSAKPAPPTAPVDAAATWRAFFEHWPPGVPQRGVLATTFDEQVPFSSFMLADELLFLERRTPDTLGSRAIILPFANIAGLKITDVIESREVRSLGFRPVVATKAKSGQLAGAH